MQPGKVDKALKNSVKEGAAYAAMDGITSSYTTPFALALGANNAQVGIVSSVPSLFSTLLQPFVGKYIDRMGRKNVCESLALLQKLLWIPIIFIPMLFLNEGLFLFILLLTLANIVVSFANTAWSSWIGALVPERIRGSFFGRRNMVQSVFSFSTTLLAGWILGFTNSLIGFSFIFFLAFIFGLTSYSFLTMIPDAPRVSNGNHDWDVKKFRNFHPFTTHMSLIVFAVNLSSPFFAVYMLRTMNIGYEWYSLVIATEIMARILMQNYWGKLSDKFGDRTILILCNALIVFYPFFWLFYLVPVQLILISVFSGIAWSGFDLATFNYLLDTTPPDKRHVYISRYKIYTGLSLFAGTFLGGILAEYLSNSTFLWMSGLQILFLISFVLRGLVTIISAPRVKAIRIKSRVPVMNVFLKAFAVYPMRGVSHDIFYIQHGVEHFERNIKKKLRRK